MILFQNLKWKDVKLYTNAVEKISIVKDAKKCVKNVELSGENLQMNVTKNLMILKEFLWICEERKRSLHNYLHSEPMNTLYL